MAAGSTYTPIATNTLGSDTATVTFSSISASYTDLVLIINGGTASTGNFYVRFNSDTGSNYSYTALYGTGSAAGSTRESSRTLLYLNYYGYGENNLNANTIVNIMNYSNTTTNKTLLAQFYAIQSFTCTQRGATNRKRQIIWKTLHYQAAALSLTNAWKMARIWRHRQPARLK